jgi:4-amino-4-deoxy-L-arabinose transferase-like glycosyltransferase
VERGAGGPGRPRATIEVVLERVVSSISRGVDEWPLRRWALGIATLALALRVGWVLAVDRVGFAFNDALMYHTTAMSLSRGEGYVPLTGGPTARWPPGYSTLLGGVYRAVGVEPVAGELVNAAIGAATVAALVLVVAAALDRVVAIVAGLGLALLPGPILWTDVLVAETLYTALFVIMIGLVLRSRPTWRWALALGAAIGIGALVRGEAFTWALLVVVVWWPLVDRRRLVSLLAVTVATVAVVIAPWTIRNAVVMDAFVPVATNASQTLWSGHHPGATGGQTYPPADYLEQFPEDVRTRELESSKALRNDAIEFMLTNPVRELQLIPLKVVHLMRGDSYALDWVNAGLEGQPGPLSPIWVERIGVVADAGWFGLLTLTVVGGVALGRSFWSRPIGRLAATSFATALFLYGFAYYGNYRYRLPYEPLMLVVAAAFVVQVWRWRSAARACRPE